MPIAHRTVDLDGIRIFYREAGRPDAPMVVLPHGYPCSSYQFSGCGWPWPTRIEGPG